MRKLLCKLFGLVPQEILIKEMQYDIELLKIANDCIYIRDSEIKSLKEQMAYLKAELSMKND